MHLKCQEQCLASRCPTSAYWTESFLLCLRCVTSSLMHSGKTQLEHVQRQTWFFSAYLSPALPTAFLYTACPCPMALPFPLMGVILDLPSYHSDFSFNAFSEKPSLTNTVLCSSLYMQLLFLKFNSLPAPSMEYQLQERRNFTSPLLWPQHFGTPQVLNKWIQEIYKGWRQSFREQRK